MSLINNLHHQFKTENARHNHHLKRNKILVLGRRGVGKLSLIKDIIAKSKPDTIKEETSTVLLPSTSTSESKDTTEHDDPIHSGLTLPWHISTRYYTADVQFWIDETVDEELVDPKVIRTYESEESGVGDVVDAVVFVFRKDEPSTFNDIRSFLPFIARYEPAITLAVGKSSNKTVATKASDMVADNQYMDWCLENGFEYVDFDARIGIDRILEALQSHMWDGMTRLSNVMSGSRSKLSFNDVADSGNDDIDNEYSSIGTVKLGNPELQYNQELLEAISQLKIGTGVTAADDIKKNKSDASQMRQHDVDSDTELFQDLPNQKEIETMHQQLFGDIDHDDDDHDDVNFDLDGNGEASDGLERVLTRLTSLREKCKSLPDDERRKLAASVAFSFGMQLEND
ncbi:4417_t:CDS:2 [Ambispora leptoticha]|uniref:4417_t:CDS:1 n=1 Tax=Ambispora leptoticha TaxID=144679 RepID=A0A9N8VGG4_9GLOM|nr:4417_t:CDS:2 [Ambispora leptoticha]